MVAGAGSSTGADSSTPDTPSAGYADGSLGTGLAPKSRSRAKARALALTQPPVVPEPGRHNRFVEVPEETVTIEVELCLAERPAPPDPARIQLIPDWAIIEVPEEEEEEEEEFNPIIIARYLRVVGNFIQIYNLHEAWLIQGEYFDHILERERDFVLWVERNGGDPRGGP